MNWADLSVLVTGGTGSFGRQFVHEMLTNFMPKRLIIFSRDELKQHEMRSTMPESDRLRFFIGDVRDADRLWRAMDDVDVVVHAAALKQVPSCEYNPIEAILTNIMGARHVIDASIDRGVKKVMFISSDKAVNPVNLYGATKLTAEKLVNQANTYGHRHGTTFASARYGNVLGSRGSVIPLFMRQRETGEVTITDPRMTRFWITLEQGVRFVISCIEQMHGGEVFVPKLPSMSLSDLARVLAPGCDQRAIGIRPGEKLHEVLVNEDEARQTVELDDRFVIEPGNPSWEYQKWEQGNALPEGFRYASDTNSWWLSDEELLELVSELIAR